MKKHRQYGLVVLSMMWIFLLAFCPSVAAYAESTDTSPNDIVIVTEVPSVHQITLKVTGNADVTHDGQAGDVFTAERFSQPVLAFEPSFAGLRITRVLINGEDITSEIKDGSYKLPPVCYDEILEIIAETEEDTLFATGGENAVLPPNITTNAAGRDNGSSRKPGAADPDTMHGRPGISTDSVASEGSPQSVTDSAGTSPPDRGTPPADGDSSSFGENPATGIAGGASIGTALLMLWLFGKKRSGSEKND